MVRVKLERRFKGAVRCVFRNAIVKEAEHRACYDLTFMAGHK
jgi:hypothetical protein